MRETHKDGIITGYRERLVCKKRHWDGRMKARESEKKYAHCGWGKHRNTGS